MKELVFAATAFAGRTVLISGGTSGIGYAAAEIFLACGASVVLMGRDQVRGETALVRLAGGARAVYCAGDVRLTEDCRAVVEEAVHAFGGLDILVNAAGIYAEGALEELSDTTLEELLDVNLKGTMQMTRAALPYLRAARGNIVNVASDAGLHGNYYCAAYAATKGAVVAFTRSLALETARDGLRVNAVAPADILTPLTERQLRPDLPREEQLRTMAELYPTGRIGTPEEAASVIAFLASSGAAWVTGSVYTVDGGLTA
ncbi:KR domain protein [Selenomonas sp. FOBRC9]|uniref:SDR family NAD(P)-dependent oxidoreductase n=1 Tax=Selenomonas sp. FOBRC9 TaxID=936573 RepID=UPI00027A44CB|nr:SDR family oxidoreductase [Selenomonas sp. FOBRC9]EJP32186.1 KR domain protein [Selenomonas sp. FOBRC9]